MQPQELMQRVKVYRLNLDGLWDDKGTGHVSVEFMEQSGSLGLVVISESDSRTLLIHRICREDIYQRQGEDTIITWTDPELQTDIALSFQEAAGCNHVWEQIQDVHQRGDVGRRRGAEPGLQRRPMVDEFDQRGASLEGDFPESGPTGPVELPPAELGNLPEIAQTLSEVSPFQRDRVAAQLMQPGYVRKLLELFSTCEDLEDAENLRHLFHIMRGAIMLNDTSLLETLLAEDAVMDVVGALEYDPEIPQRQRHREFLQQSVVFKEVVPIGDPAVRAKIHQTYRMGYLKDVILPRVLDDGTFATLSSLMLFNNVEVLMALTQDKRFFPELFGRLKELSGGPLKGDAASSDQAWTDLVAFLQELCGLSKHLQVNNRGLLLTNLNNLGLFEVMTDVIARGGEDIQLRATDVLLSSLQHDAALLRDFLEQQPEHRLMKLLVELLTRGKDGGVQEQVLEIWKILLDPDTMEGAVEKNRFLDLFYEGCIGTLTETLAESALPKDGKAGSPMVAASTLGLLVDLLCFCVQHHQYRVKYYILRSDTVGKVLRLLRRREKWLVVAALRFLRTCIGLKDEFYNRYLVRNNLFEPVIEVFLANGTRYNLLNSAVLELVDFVRKENIKSLVTHLVEMFYSRLEHVDYVETFKSLKLKYDQSQERGGPSGPSNDVNRARELLTAARHRRDARALPKDEEDYFNESDDDDGDLPGPGPPPPHEADGSGPPRLHPAGTGGDRLNGFTLGRRRSTPSPERPASFPLVDYDDDDDDDVDDDDAAAAAADGAAPAVPATPANSSSSSVGEKRREAHAPETSSKRARSEEHWDKGPSSPRPGPPGPSWRR